MQSRADRGRAAVNPHPPTGLHAVLSLCSLSFQTRSSLRFDRHRGSFSTAALAIQVSAQHSCARLAHYLTAKSHECCLPAYLAVSHAFLSQLPWRK